MICPQIWGEIRGHWGAIVQTCDQIDGNIFSDWWANPL